MSEPTVPEHAYPNALPRLQSLLDRLKVKIVLFLIRDLKV